MDRKLSLKRDVIQELAADELSEVVGGTLTRFSCLPYVSCNPVACVIQSVVCE